MFFNKSKVSLDIHGLFKLPWVKYDINDKFYKTDLVYPYVTLYQSHTPL